MKRIIIGIARFLGATGRATIALVGICGVVAALANYTMTQGSGTTFGSVVVAGVHYAQQFICDVTTPSQCAAVDTHGQQLIDVNTTNNNLYGAMLSGVGPVAPGTAATTSVMTGGVFNTTAPTLTNGQQAASQLSARGGVLRGSDYPAGSTPITISGTGTTAATTATLATGASVTTYICGFSIRANATAAATGNATVTGTITGTLNYTQWTAPNASGLGVTEQIFTPCIPASAVNTGIAVISAAPGTGGVVSVTAWGYIL